MLFVFASPASTETNSPTLLVLGDSLSAGYGLAPDEGWVSLLQQRLKDKKLNWSVVNASISGDTTQSGLSRLHDALEIHQPQVVIIELGGNDGLRGLPLQRIRDNLRELVRQSRASGARILLLGVRLPANYGAYAERFHALYRDVADAEQVPLVDFFLEGVAETREQMQADGIHPTAAAQPRILENVWPALAPLLQSESAAASEAG